MIIKCWFGYHQYFVLRPLSEWSDLLACEKCKKLFCYNKSEKILLSYNSDFEKFYIDIKEMTEK